MRTYQFAEDAGPNAHPVRPDKVVAQDNFYSVTIYEKGAEIIRMLHTIIGEEKFMAGMRLFVERFDGKAVTCDDFIDCMQDAADYDLTQFRLWYSQSGTPEVRMGIDFNRTKEGVGDTMTFKFTQRLNPTY
jgi:aminopeptidase N